MQAKWKCQKHENQGVNFVCIGNCWHFEPLCNECIPNHTKNHPKNIKIQMQTLSTILTKSAQIKEKVLSIYSQKHKKCLQISKIEVEELPYIKLLKQKKEELIVRINSAFNGIIASVKDKRMEQMKRQEQNIQKIIKTLEQNIQFLSKESQTTSIVDFCREIKKFYFKESLQMYIEQVDEIVKEYEHKVINCSPIIWNKDIQIKFDKFINDIHKIQEEKKEKVQKIDANPKKQTKKKEVQKKKCPNCKEQMQYLTEWKKHLICRNCGTKQRNYIKKA